MQLQRRVSEGLRQRPKSPITPEQIRAIAEEVQGIDGNGVRRSIRYNSNQSADRNQYYDYSKSFAEQLLDYQNGTFPQRDSFVLGATPEVFQRIGFNALPMTINQTHVYDALNGTRDADHTFGMSLLKTLPDALQHPVAVITSQTQNGTSVVALLEMQVNGKTVVAPVTIDGFAYENGVLIDSNAVTSVYGKGGAITNLLASAIQEEQNGNVGVYYIDKNKAAGLLQNAGLQLPGILFRTDGYIHSIRDSSSPVKPKFENATKTRQFKRWFGDWEKKPHTASKVVNADGTPKVVYHGTNADFWTFDLGKSGQNFGDVSDGLIFFTNKKDGYQDSAADYARKAAENGGKERIIECYLDIKKPLHLYSDGAYTPTAYFDQNAESIYSQYLSGDYDGIIIENSDKSVDDSVIYMVDNSAQIKSATDNIGTFDRTNPDIRYSLSGINSGNVEELLAPYIKQYGGMELPG